ncbi:hypothetical protein KQI63_15660 [bacterium]|nr:hypothetical protein [bacterium]
MKTWKVPAYEADRKANGGTIEGDLSFDGAAQVGDGTIRVEGAGNLDSLSLPGVGNIGGPDETTVNHADWNITEEQFKTARDACTGSPGSCSGGVTCSSGSNLLVNNENHYAV